MSSTDCYLQGKFDTALILVLEQYESIMNIMLPTLGPERQATHSPFFPICPTVARCAGRVVDRSVAAGTITYVDPESGAERETKVTGGNCKLQWKCDWAMRWFALGVDYEMSGKDLIDSQPTPARSPAPLVAWHQLVFLMSFLMRMGRKFQNRKEMALLRIGCAMAAQSHWLFMYSQPKRLRVVF